MQTTFRKHAVLAKTVFAAVLCSAAARAEGDEPSKGMVQNTALWAGARAGFFVPYGGLFTAKNLVTTEFHDVAVGGPEVELDVGVKIGRHWVAYGFSEFVSLGRGNQSVWTDAHGGGASASTHAGGLALRWITNPDGWGGVVDLGLGYRWLVVNWQDGTTLRLGGWGDARLGVGTNVRVGRLVELSPLLTFYAGTFRDRTLAGQPIGDSSSSYTAMALAVGGHFDLFGGLK